MTDWRDFPRCSICDSGGIAASDCPHCRFRILAWYQEKLTASESQLDARPKYGTSKCGHSERFLDWEDHGKPIVCLKCQLAAEPSKIPGELDVTMSDNPLTTTDVLNLLCDYAAGGAVVDRSLIAKVQAEIERLTKERDEAIDAAKFVYRFGRCDNAIKLYPWLKED